MNTDGLYTNFAEHSVAVKPSGASRLYRVLLIFGALSVVFTFMILIGIFAKPFIALVPVLGVLAIFFLQYLFNLGMCFSLLPVMGNVLPFISCGGSSVLSCYIALGVALSVYMHPVHQRLGFVERNAYSSMVRRS